MVGMILLDRVFEVLLARWRRKLGDSKLELAWKRANFKMSGYLLPPVATVTMLLVSASYLFLRTGSFVEHKRAVQIIGVGIWFGMSMMLERRFRKYLVDPPAVPAEESSEDRRFLLEFRVTTLGTFLLMCLAGFLLHRAGVRLL